MLGRVLSSPRFKWFPFQSSLYDNVISTNGLQYLQVNSDRKSQTSVSDLLHTQPKVSVLTF